MRTRLWISACAAVAMAGVAAGLGFAAPKPSGKLAERSGTPVDVVLALGVDVSYSMDPEEQALQREGYIAAITSPDFMRALRQGMHGKIALTYYEWAGSHHTEVIVPWRVVDNPETADSFVAEIARAKYTRASRTSVAAAIQFGASLIEASGYRGLRRVIDISGDGVNNNGPLVTDARDEVVAKGVTINGLPIILKRPIRSTFDITDLDIYFEDCVIGGPGAFVIPIRAREQFKEAIRTKLVLEVAGRMPEPRVIPAQGRKPRVSCTIGEQIWQQRWGN